MRAAVTIAENLYSLKKSRMIVSGVSILFLLSVIFLRPGSNWFRHFISKYHGVVKDVDQDRVSFVYVASQNSFT